MIDSVNIVGVQRWRRDFRTARAGLGARTQSRLRLCLFATGILVAYHLSLVSLVQTVGLDTPLAYLGLVPFIAMGLAVLHRNPDVGEHPIHDRQLDYILGTPILLAALFMVVVLPKHMGAMYWVDRIDLLSVPIFLAGTTILLFGTRVAWRQRAAIAFTILAWPWPYTNILLGTLNGFTDLTLAGLRFSLTALPVARAVPGADNQGLFVVTHAGKSFPVSVVSACSGIDGMVGFFLIGSAFALLVRGPVLRKVTWLATGIVLLWMSNIARLLLIFWSGRRYGESVALGVLHPIAGLVLFLLVVAVMFVLLRPFGLQIPLGAAKATPAAPRQEGLRSLAVPRFFTAASLVVAASLLAGVSDAKLANFEPISTASGDALISSYLADPAVPSGWSVAFSSEYSINKPLFGQSSRWWRYTYTPMSSSNALYANSPVTADVIDASGQRGFSSYGITACYSFHGYRLTGVSRADLGDGLTGQTLSYAGSSSKQDWSLVYWVWPVVTSTGTRYERVVLYITDNSSTVVRDPTSSKEGSPRATKPTTQAQRLAANRAFLVAFGRAVVKSQIHSAHLVADIAMARPPGTWLTAAANPGTRPSGARPSPTTAAVKGVSEPAARVSVPAPGVSVPASTTFSAFWKSYAAKHPLDSRSR